MSRNAPYVAEGPLGVDDFQKLHVNADKELLVAGTVAGEVSVSGLKTGGRNTTMNVTDSAGKIPLVPFANRNSMSITNLSPVDTVFIGFDGTVTADRVIGTTSGAELGPNEGMNFDLTEAVEIWGITETGKTYDFKAFLYFAWRVLLRKCFNKPLPKANKWDDEHGFLCTELADALPVPLKIDSDTAIITPYGLWEIYKEKVSKYYPISLS